VSEYRSYNVTVCGSCLRASCWHGTFPCDDMLTAGVTNRTAGQLDALGLEHRDHYSPVRLYEVSGQMPESHTGARDLALWATAAARGADRWTFEAAESYLREALPNLVDDEPWPPKRVDIGVTVRRIG
jgi:hypothetical protein